MHNKPVNKELVEKMWEDEFVYDVFNYIGNYGIPTGDLQRLNSWGIVKRNSQDTIVLIDFGLNSDVKASYYS